MQSIKNLPTKEIEEFLFLHASTHTPVRLSCVKGLSLNSYGYTYYGTTVIDGIEKAYLESCSKETKEAVLQGHSFYYESLGFNYLEVTRLLVVNVKQKQKMIRLLAKYINELDFEEFTDAILVYPQYKSRSEWRSDWRVGKKLDKMSHEEIVEIGSLMCKLWR